MNHLLKIANPVVVAKVVPLLQPQLHAQRPKWDAMILAHAATVVNSKSVVVSACSVLFKTVSYRIGKPLNL